MSGWVGGWMTSHGRGGVGEGGLTCWCSVNKTLALTKTRVLYRVWVVMRCHPGLENIHLTTQNRYTTHVAKVHMPVQQHPHVPHAVTPQHTRPLIQPPTPPPHPGQCTPHNATPPTPPLSHHGRLQVCVQPQLQGAGCQCGPRLDSRQAGDLIAQPLKQQPQHSRDLHGGGGASSTTGQQQHSKSRSGVDAMCMCCAVHLLRHHVSVVPTVTLPPALHPPPPPLPQDPAQPRHPHIDPPPSPLH